MFDKMLENINCDFVWKLVAFHTFIIALSNYLVTLKFNLFPGANLPLNNY